MVFSSFWVLTYGKELLYSSVTMLTSNFFFTITFDISKCPVANSILFHLMALAWRPSITETRIGQTQPDHSAVTSVTKNLRKYHGRSQQHLAKICRSVSQLLS